MGHSEQTRDWVWARRNRPKIGYGPDDTDRCLGIGQTEQTEDWVWTRRNRPMLGYWTDRTDRRLDMGQSEQTHDWVWARRYRPKIGYEPDETDRCWVMARPNIPNSGMGQTEQTQFRYGPDGVVRPKICPDYEFGRTGPPCLRPRSVWPILVLGRGLHPGSTNFTIKDQSSTGCQTSNFSLNEKIDHNMCFPL